MAEETYLGAQHDLDRLVQTHLFILSPNNGGSTFLRRSIENCARVWSLPREGQHVFGFPGPSTQESRDALIWNSSADRRARFTHESAYDWEAARRAWYFQATASSAEADIFVTSSPPFLLNMAALQQSFRDARFLVMTRHPMAIAEGILRRPIERRLDPHENRLQVAAHHIGECLTRLRSNLEREDTATLQITYEDMCANPAETAQKIGNLVPGLDDLQFDRPIAVKGKYYEPVRNMNADAFARLGTQDKNTLRTFFEPYSDAIAFFGYDLEI
ncbi:sulfotransferase [Aurantiacibacter poecillastricola]|uniref:sulfotransferase n=1 Tax=Aurantiacibacter poecillastricola TaxID=3064385 RepID=UPI00273FADBA|nr:sulfotransferase [Aurantiacibacter sp. 219JJ12-13]MDP5263059.1 sulfotransferase [Aurantiacibacter sp. 219JJ12-13]